MKHGIAFRKLGRSSSHRMLMLRNLVTSLFEHEQIKTTLPKAREAARLAEKIITMGKRGTIAHVQRASAFMMKPAIVPKLFNVLAQRYAERPGGYTRIHKFGNRMGDNAPHAILELVDNPRDLKFEITARAVGWELFSRKSRGQLPTGVDIHDVSTVGSFVADELAPRDDQRIKFREMTSLNLRKTLRYRSEAGLQEFGRKARDQDMLSVLPEAQMSIPRALDPEKAGKSNEDDARHHMPGERLPEMNPRATGLSIAKRGLHGYKRWDRRKLGFSSPTTS